MVVSRLEALRRTFGNQNGMFPRREKISSNFGVQIFDDFKVGLRRLGDDAQVHIMQTVYLDSIEL